MSATYSATDLTGRRQSGHSLPKHDAGKLERILMKEFVARWLSREEHLVITLYYCEELTIPEIAAVLKIPEDRIAAIHDSILERMETQFLAKLGEANCVA